MAGPQHFVATDGRMDAGIVKEFVNRPCAAAMRLMITPHLTGAPPARTPHPRV